MNPIIQAVDTLTDAKIKGLKFDKTITGNIIDVVDYNQGIYRAKYESGTFLVYAEDPNMIYQKGDSIYIKIPEGDYSNKKFIEGKVKTGADTSSIIELSQTLVHSDKIFTEKDLNEELFKEYLKIYKNQWLKVSASFSGTANNDYGYNFSQGNKPIGVFNTADMNGSIFTPNGETQSKYIKLLDNTYDITYEKIGNEIQGTNLTFQFCAEEDFSTTPYYLTINQLDNDPLKLQGRLFNSGKEIAGLKYHWYCLATDAEIAEFDAELGFPWVKIEDQASSTLEVAAPAGQQTYKLVVEYTTGKKISQDYIVNLTPSSENDTIVYFDEFKGIIENKDKKDYPFLKSWKKQGNNLYTSIWKNPNNDKNILIEGQNLFYFDANSNISADIGDKEYVLIPYYFGDETIKEVNWYITNGIDKDSNTWENKIEKNKVYNPHHSMLKNVWIDVNNNLRYSIKDTYSITNYNNIFRLEYVFSNDSKIYQTQEIFFVKDGQQGTNSSEYCCNIRPVNQQGAYINDEEFAAATSKCLSVETFNNSKLINREIIKNVSGDTYKATIKIDSYTLYFHYPIYSATISIDYLEIPKYIQYAASGYSPKWYNRTLKIPKDLSGNDSIAINNNKLKPVVPFKGGSKIGKLSNFVNGYNFPIIMYVEYQSNSTIEGWDGTSITINGDNQEIINPQIGVGDTSGKFTGLVMSENNGGGLYGYLNGDNTLGITANGDAYFKEIGIREKNAGGNEGTIGIFMGREDSEVIGIQSSGKSVAIEVPIKSNIRLSSNEEGAENIRCNGIYAYADTIALLGEIVTIPHSAFYIGSEGYLISINNNILDLYEKENKGLIGKLKELEGEISTLKDEINTLKNNSGGNSSSGNG